MAPKTRPTAASVKDSQNTARPTRKRRASSQRASAPRAKRSRTDAAQDDVEGEDITLDEEEQEVEQDVQVIFDDRPSPAGVLPSSPPVYQTTTLTQQMRETTVKSTPIARPTKSVRGRKSMSAQLGTLTSDIEERQFAPLEAIDPHSKRRLSRNHLSEEQNEYTTRLHALQKEHKGMKAQIQELEYEREAERQMGVANTLEHEKDNEIEKLKREKARLEDKIAKHRDHEPQDDAVDLYHDNAMDDAEALDFSAHNENVVVRTTNGDLTHHHPNHTSCRAIVDEYQNQLFQAGKIHAELTKEVEGLRIRLRNLGFSTDDEKMLDIVTNVHEAFVSARTELSKLDMLPDEHFDTMANDDLLKLMVGLLQNFRQQLAILTVSEQELKMEVADLQETLDAKDILKDSLDRDNDSLLRDKVQLQEELEESQTARAAKEEELATVIQDFQDEISTLKSEHDEQMSGMAQAMEDETQARLESEQEKNDQIAVLRSKLESAFQVQEKAGDTLLDAGINTDALIDGITELRRRRETEQHQRELAERYLDEANTKIETMEAQSVEDTSKIHELNLDINKLKSDIFGQQQSLEAAIAEKKKLIEEHNAIVVELHNSHSIAMDREVALRQSIIDDMDKTIAEERETGMTLHRKADSLKEENQQLEADLDSTNARNEELDAAIDELRTLIEEKDETIKSLSSDIDGLEDTIQQHESTIQELTATKAELEATCEEKDATIQVLGATIQVHEATIAQHEGTIRARDTTVQEDKLTIEEYREKVDLLTTQVTEKEGAITDYEDDLGQLRKKYATSEKKNRHYEALFDAIGQHNQRISHESHGVSQLLLQRDVLPVGEDGDVEFDEEDTMVGTPDVASVQKAKAHKTTTTTTALHRSYNLRNAGGKEHRDSGVVMDSSPIRQHHGILEEVDE
ncbi:putative beta-glucosidase M [Venturia nashicola]|uniref:Putative beta-glucosidase M n=1 Tax=Venturia nashicola TaxID=86259 RepID=A0A4Z1PCP2_9PEZI|nr:putative beta-glucosidase M [Venturia nashicola]